MSDGELVEECLKLAQSMEKGWITEDEAERIKITFNFALGNPKFEPLHDTLVTALKVLELLKGQDD